MFTVLANYKMVTLKLDVYVPITFRLSYRLTTPRNIFTFPF